MNVAFRKRVGRYSQLICTRDDGSRTESLFPNLGSVPHDLVHYVVEKTLGLRHAFYGLVANGAPIAYSQDHNHPIARNVDASESSQSETLVEALQLAALSEGDCLEDFTRLVHDLCRERAIPTPTISERQLRAICTELKHYRRAWQSLGPNHQLSVSF